MTHPQDHTAALTYADALRIARGCTDYGGGYRGDAALFEAYQHGIQTVITALTHADPKDSQTRALMAMGAQPQQQAGWKLVPVEPSTHMLSAGCHGHTYLSYGDCKRIYGAMLEAASTPPAPAESQGVLKGYLVSGGVFYHPADRGVAEAHAARCGYEIEGLYAALPPQQPAQADIQCLLDFIFQRFGAPGDAGELTNEVVASVRRLEKAMSAAQGD